MGYRVGRAFTKFTSAVSFGVLILSLLLAVASVPSNRAVLDAHALNQAKDQLRWVEERAAGKISAEWVARPAPDLIPSGMFFLASFTGLFVCSICFCILAIFDIADRLRDEKATSPAIQEIPPTPSAPLMPSETEVAEQAERDRSAEVARRIAEYEAGKNK